MPGRRRRRALSGRRRRRNRVVLEREEVKERRSLLLAATAGRRGAVEETRLEVALQQVDVARELLSLHPRYGTVMRGYGRVVVTIR